MDRFSDNKSQNIRKIRKNKIIKIYLSPNLKF